MNDFDEVHHVDETGLELIYTEDEYRKIFGYKSKQSKDSVLKDMGKDRIFANGKFQNTEIN